LAPSDASEVWRRFDKESRPEVRIVLKADTQGTLRVAQKALMGLGGRMANLQVIRGDVGDVVPSDVFLAETTKASILGFGTNVHRDAIAKAKDKVGIQSFRTLQDVVGAARSLLEDALPFHEEEERIGRVEIRKIIKSSKTGRIAGCFVVEGVVRRNAQLRLMRNNVVLWQGRSTSLRRFKDEAKEVRENFECGILLAGYEDIEVGDVLEVLDIRKIKQRLVS
jgi:translation initiation factor IF-2